MTHRTVVWGTGNLGRAAVRSVLAHPDLELVAVLTSTEAKAGQDAGTMAGIDPVGVPLTTDVDAALAGADAVVYAASGDLRPDDAAEDVRWCLAAGAVTVTPSLYAMYDPASAPASLREPLEKACVEGGSALLVSGIDPGWGNDLLPVLMSGLVSEIDQVRAMELFDYSTDDAPEAVRGSVGMGGSMDAVPMMVLPGVPTMIWGGQVRLVARALGVEVDEIVERVERRPLEQDVTNAMGLFEKGTQGALRFEVAGVSGGRDVVVVEHVTRITPDIAPDWPAPADGGAGAHRVVLEGRPRLEVTVEAEEEGGNRAAGGNATAVNRLVGALPWLRQAAPGVYDGLQVPLTPAVGRFRKG